MKLRYLLLGVLAFTVLSTTAQLRWGVEAGVNVSHAFERTETKVGFNLGATGEYAFAKHWFADAALKLSSQPCGDRSWLGGNYYDTPNSAPEYYVERDYTPYYLTLPVRVGYSFGASSNVKLSVAAGPIIGLGLWGKGHAKQVSYVTAEQPGKPVVTYDGKLGNISKDVPYGYATSRFEYGANLRIVATIADHYRIGAEYSILHIPGLDKSVDNVNIYSINIGYVF